MFVVGKVLKPQGRKGEVKVEVITSFPEHFEKLKTLFVEENRNWKTYPIEYARSTDRFVFIKFIGIDSIDQAEQIKNELVWPASA